MLGISRRVVRDRRGLFFSLLGLPLLALLAWGCSCSEPVDPPDEDAGMDAGPEEDAGPRAVCGNAETEPGEDCDDGNRDEDDYCLRDCTFACGDGTVNAVELCDVAIAEGEPGACPSACDDGEACTSDVLSGSGCEAECVSAPIRACMSGDGCCPAGCDAIMDDDCAAVCGNGLIEPGESCEAGVGAGCESDPAVCDDGAACTVDRLIGSAATCDVACENAPVTACVGGDGCCAAGCDASADADCSASCGDMVLDPGELCEEGSSTPCPTDCDDAAACTADTLTGTPAACNVQCAHAPIRACANGDGCCPSACNALNDRDCSSVCGNRVIEPGEDCDDGNFDPTDGCDLCSDTAHPTAFRLTDLDLRDPHVFTEVAGCRDITESVLGMDGVNPLVQAEIQSDDNGDGVFDLSFAGVFRPLIQTAGLGASMDLIESDCTFPASTSVCYPSVGAAPTTLSYTSQGTGACLAPVAGSTSGFVPGIASPSAPCFVTDPADVTLDLGGILFTLNDAQIAATYVGIPASSVRNGLIRGFLTRANAESVILPSALVLVGGMSLASLLRGHPDNCSTASDMDVHPTLGAGWWFYLNFPATEVRWGGP